MKFLVSKPKLKVRLTFLLWTIFALLVLGQVLALYKYLYADFKASAVSPEPQPTAILRIDEVTSQQVKAWWQDRQNFELPAYKLQAGDVGRENPFAEY